MNLKDIEKEFDKEFEVDGFYGTPFPELNGREVFYKLEILEAVKKHNKKIKNFLIQSIKSALEEVKPKKDLYGLDVVVTPRPHPSDDYVRGYKKGTQFIIDQLEENIKNFLSE